MKSTSSRGVHLDTGGDEESKAGEAHNERLGSACFGITLHCTAQVADGTENALELIDEVRG